MLAYWYPIATALCYRIRGGALPTKSTTFARLVAWALPWASFNASLIYIQGYSLILCLVIGAATFAPGWLGLLIPHGEHQKSGRYDRPPDPSERPLTLWLGLPTPEMSYLRRWWIDFAGMSIIGATRNLGTILPVVWCYPWLLLLIPASVLHGASYTAGWALDGRVTVPKLAECGTDWAELFVGYYTGLLYVLLASLSWG